MERKKGHWVTAWGLALASMSGGAAFAQAPQFAYPPQAATPAPPPAPPVFVPGLPVPAPPAPPAAPMWTPDFKSFEAFKAYAGQQTGERRVETMDTPFPDPARPGTVAVQLLSGSIRVKAANRKDVGIRVTHSGRASMLPRKQEPPPAGMRRLTPVPEGPVTADGNAQGNQIVLRLASPFVEADVELEVPARTNLNLRVVSGGAIEVEGVEGNLELNNVNGPIRLQDVSGSVVAAAVNGDVTVVMTRVAEQKVMAFSSLNGKLDVTLPRTTKANLKLRSDNGDVFTDFDVVQTQAPPSSAAATSSQTTQTGATGRADLGARIADVDRRVADLNRRYGRRGERYSDRTIYGTINGGGPEIEARSFNGSVFIRRAQK